MKKWISKIALGICLLVFGLGFCVFAAEDTILDGVAIGEVDVSGMTKAQAMDALASYVEDVKEQTITLKIGDNTLEAPLSEYLAGLCRQPTIS